MKGSGGVTDRVVVLSRRPTRIRKKITEQSPSSHLLRVDSSTGSPLDVWVTHLVNPLHLYTSSRGGVQVHVSPIQDRLTMVHIC